MKTFKIFRFTTETAFISEAQVEAESTKDIIEEILSDIKLDMEGHLNTYPKYQDINIDSKNFNKVYPFMKSCPNEMTTSFRLGVTYRDYENRINEEAFEEVTVIQIK